MLFHPEPIANRTFNFSEELVARVTKAEFEYVRADEESVRFPFGSALRHSLSRLEAISTASITGPTPDLRLMIWLRTQSAQDKEHAPGQSRHPFTLSARVERATRIAFRYQSVIEDVASMTRQSRLTERDFIDMHAFLARGQRRTKENRGDFRYRHKRLSQRKPGGECIGKTYAPPTPEEIPALMNDLFAYLHTPRLTPCMQAAIAHFQLQAICPFESSMDRSERSLSLVLLHQRGISQHLIPTIGFPLASGYEGYVHSLMPYRWPAGPGGFDYMDALDKWIRCCASDLEQSVRVVRTYMASLREIDEYYRARLGQVRQGSTIDVLVRELPGLPILDSSIAMELTGKSFSAVTEALGILVQKGIMKQVGISQRNRLYEAPDIVQNEQRLLDATLPDTAKHLHDSNF